ncbi:MAG: hypothetical protein H0X24_12530 [Ktedonobacterales bacterium]|nr:hypothetical protein [Ktedonobacterales bacterium]
MIARFSALVLFCLSLGGCGSTHGIAPMPSPTAPLNCSAQYTGHGIDTLAYALTCHFVPPADATAVTLTGKAPTTAITYTWCDHHPIVAPGVASCLAQFVVIVPQSIQRLTVTATFFPQQEHQTTTITVQPPA